MSQITLSSSFSSSYSQPPVERQLENRDQESEAAHILYEALNQSRQRESVSPPPSKKQRIERSDYPNAIANRVAHVASTSLTSSFSKQCPPSPFRKTTTSHKAFLNSIPLNGSKLLLTAEEEAKETKANLYRNDGIPVGEEIASGSCSTVYINKNNANEVIKIPRYKIWNEAKKIMVQTAKLYTELQSNQIFNNTGLCLIEAKLSVTKSGNPFLTQPFIPKSDRFSVENHMHIPEVQTLLKNLFELCFSGQLPALDLSPSNLVYKDGKLGLLDWLITDDAKNLAPGELFSMYANSRIQEFGIGYKKILDPEKKAGR